MQFERIKKSHKKEIIIGGLIVLGVVSALTLVTTRAKYKVTENIKLVDGTINYKPYDFKVMAMYQQNDSGTYTEINEMPASGYVINEDKTYCTIDNQTQVKGKIKTIDGNVAISNLSKSDKCYLYFDKYSKSITIPDIIATLNAKSTTPDFSQVATADEGVFKVADGMYGGTSYYWRGAVTNNYVKFAGFCWRIIRINGDGSMRLIYDGTTCHANGISTEESVTVLDVVYNLNNNQSNYVGWTYEGTSQRPNGSGTSSNAKVQLENWYSENITEANIAKLAEGKYCNDRNVVSGSSWKIDENISYAAVDRMKNYQPTLSCSNKDTYTLNVGLITADEVMLAGGGLTDNKTYYLYREVRCWTMSPRIMGAGSAWVYVIDRSTGKLDSGNVSSPSRGLRPVINLKADITFSSGDGTLNNPYVVS